MQTREAGKVIGRTWTTWLQFQVESPPFTPPPPLLLSGCSACELAMSATRLEMPSIHRPNHSQRLSSGRQPNQRLGLVSHVRRSVRLPLHHHLTPRCFRSRSHNRSWRKLATMPKGEEGKGKAPWMKTTTTPPLGGRLR